MIETSAQKKAGVFYIGIFCIGDFCIRKESLLTLLKVCAYCHLNKSATCSLPFSISLHSVICCLKQACISGLPSAAGGVIVSWLIPVVAVSPLGFPGPPAFRAPLRLVFEPLFLVESLFAFRKDEFLMAILANQCFVGHIFTSWSIWI